MRVVVDRDSRIEFGSRQSTLLFLGLAGVEECKLVSNKVAQKKVREAMDEAHEDVVKQDPLTNKEFMHSWVQKNIRRLARSSGGNPKNSLSEDSALRLFTEVVQEGGGLPLLLCQTEGKPGLGEAMSAAHANFGDAALQGGGKGGCLWRSRHGLLRTVGFPTSNLLK